MAGNHNKLNYKGMVFRNGDAIPKTTDIDDFINKGKEQNPCLYIDSLRDEYFYNYYALQDASGFAPVGYMIPSPQDWMRIFDYSGVENVYDNDLDWTDSIEEEYVLDNSNNSYTEMNLNKFKTENESSNLNIQLAGYVSLSNGRVGVNKTARFWTSSDRSSWNDSNNAFWVGLNSNYIFLGAYDHIRDTYASKVEGLSVRLVEDDYLDKMRKGQF